MKSSIRRSALAVFAGIAFASAWASVPAPAFAEEDSGNGFEVAVDCVLLRPLGTARLLIGGVLLVPSTFINVLGLPFGRDTSVFKDDVDRLIIEPAQYTFQRPLGVDLAGG